MSTEPSPNSKRQRLELNWRMDPKESRSDFIIEIAVLRQSEAGNNSEDASAITTYHVHKNILEFGKKASGYFAALFASQTAESMNNKTRIKLNFEPAAKAVPLLLDFMYGLDDGVPALTMENAAPLYHLLDYFEVDLLDPKQIPKFWEDNMGLENFATCLKQAKMYRIDSLRKIVVKKCAKRISEVTVDSPLMKDSKSKFWLDVFAEGYHPHLAVLVGEFCYRRKDKLGAKTFSQLMKRLLGTVHIGRLPIDSAMKLLEVDKAVMPKVKNRDREMTRIQRHLLGALTYDWERWLDATILQDSLKKVSPILYSHAMDLSLRLACEEKGTLSYMLDNAAGGLPTTIYVTGSGIAAASGVYSRCDNFDPAKPKYVMNGFYEETQATFSISSAAVGPTKVSVWYISARYLQSTVYFYYSLPFTNTRLVGLPRMNGWWAYRIAGTSPTLSYN